MYGYCDHCEKYDIVHIDEDFPQFRYCAACTVLILSYILEHTELDTKDIQ